MRRITIDTETTGFDPSVAGIIEVGGVVFEDGAEVAQFSEICKPHESCLVGPKVDEALAFSGITRAEIMAARSADVVREELSRWLAKWPADEKLHSFNVAFDARFLAKEPWMIYPTAWGECIMEAAAEVMGPMGVLSLFKNGHYKWPKLIEAAQFCGVMSCGEHRALNDARTAALVYEEILKRRR